VSLILYNQLQKKGYKANYYRVSILIVQRIKQVFFLCHFILDSSKKGQKRPKNGKKTHFWAKFYKSYRRSRISGPGGRVEPFLTRNTIVGRAQSRINPKISIVGIKK
jgi:hypothetical protein